MRQTCGWVGVASASTPATAPGGGCYPMQCDDADVLDDPAYERTRLDVAGEARSLRCVPRAVWRWARVPGGVATGDARCDGPTLGGTVAARAREWSDHVRSVVASVGTLERKPVRGEC